MARVLVVTIAIGERYVAIYNSLYRRSQANYCDKHGYDFHLCDYFLDPNESDPTLISIQKLLLCSQEWANNYDFLVFVDADILINTSIAPAIHAATDYDDKIGIVDDMGQVSPEELKKIRGKLHWETTPIEYYHNAGFEIKNPIAFNTGVLVFQPRKHKDFLRGLYKKYKEKQRNHPRAFEYEQSFIGWHLLTEKKFKLIDKRFNAIYFYRRNSSYGDITLQNFFHENYFIHLAGGGGRRREHIIGELNGVEKNEPCPCGSGKKFKNCHGLPRLPRSLEKIAFWRPRIYG